MNLFERKMIVCTFLIAIISAGTLSNLPAGAKINGMITRSHFYDSEKTIMPDVPTDTTFKTGKYWEKNLFYANKYRPLFMLSNKDLYNLMPEKRVSVVQRIITPSVYNISLKNSSIKKVSLSGQTKTSFMAPKKIASIQMVQAPLKNSSPIVSGKTVVTQDSKSTSVYEQAKNPGMETEQKTDAALILKDTKDPANYALAIDLLDDVTRAEPYNAYAYYLKGEIYYAKKDRENAMKNYAEALKLNPTSKQSCLGIAKVLEPTNKELAQKYYEKAK